MVYRCSLSRTNVSATAQTKPAPFGAGSRTLRYFQFHTAMVGNIFVITRRHTIDCDVKAFLTSVERLTDGVLFAKLHKLDDEFAELYSNTMTIGCVGREMKNIADNSMGEHMNVFEVHNVVPLKGRGGELPPLGEERHSVQYALIASSMRSRADAPMINVHTSHTIALIS